jgi:hypothetical protein
VADVLEELGLARAHDADDIGFREQPAGELAVPGRRVYGETSR